MTPHSIASEGPPPQRRRPFGLDARDKSVATGGKVGKCGCNLGGGHVTADTRDALSDALMRCAAGDRDALRLIFDSEAPRLVAIAARILRRRELAEEAVQDAFVQIWRKASQYAPDRGSARGWICAVVRNRALNMLRDGRREELAGDDAIAEMRDAAHVDEAHAAFLELDSKSRLRDCLSTLDEPKRNSILMAYVSGFTHGEIAGRLGVPLGTAKAWVRRGLASLRECMA
jgi:RNA polymerase sigma-70 factor (ECF subfamily)